MERVPCGPEEQGLLAEHQKVQGCHIVGSLVTDADQAWQVSQRQGGRDLCHSESSLCILDVKGATRTPESVLRFAQGPAEQAIWHLEGDNAQTNCSQTGAKALQIFVPIKPGELPGSSHGEQALF